MNEEHLQDIFTLVNLGRVPTQFEVAAGWFTAYAYAFGAQARDPGMMTLALGLRDKSFALCDYAQRVEEDLQDAAKLVDAANACCETWGRLLLHVELGTAAWGEYAPLADMVPGAAFRLWTRAIQRAEPWRGRVGP